jgi:glycine cleavage system H protein
MKFSQTHEWIQQEGNNATIGISDYAQKELGEIVYVELPSIGQTIRAGEEAVVLESTKAAVDIYSPLSGKIIAINEDLKAFPEKINHSAEGDGWLFKLEIGNPTELNVLMTDSAYRAFLSH